MPYYVYVDIKSIHYKYSLKTFIFNMPTTRRFIALNSQKINKIYWSVYQKKSWHKSKRERKKNCMYNGLRIMFSQNITKFFPEIFVISSISVIVCMESIIIPYTFLEYSWMYPMTESYGYGVKKNELLLFFFKIVCWCQSTSWNCRLFFRNSIDFKFEEPRYTMSIRLNACQAVETGHF